MNLGASPLLPPRVRRYSMDMSNFELPNVTRWWTPEDYVGVGLFGAYTHVAAGEIRAQAFWGLSRPNSAPYAFHLTDPVTLFPISDLGNALQIRIAKAQILNVFGVLERFFLVAACPSFAGSGYSVGLVRDPLTYTPGEAYRVGPYIFAYTPTQTGAVTPIGLNGATTHLLVAVPLADRVCIDRYLLVRDTFSQEIIELQPDGYTEWIHGQDAYPTYLRQQYVGALEGVFTANGNLFTLSIQLDDAGNVVSGYFSSVQMRAPYGENLLHGWNPDDGTLIFSQEGHTYVGRVVGLQLLDPIDVEQPYDPRNNRYLWEPSEIKWLPLTAAGPQTLAQRYYMDKNQWAYFGMLTMSPPSSLG